MCSINLEPCDVWEERVDIAATDLKCDACGAPIRAGKKYLKHHNEFEGRKTNESMCMPCKNAREKFADAHGQYFTPSSMYEMFWECIDEGDEDAWKWRVMLNRVSKRAERLRAATGAK